MLGLRWQVLCQGRVPTTPTLARHVHDLPLFLLGVELEFLGNSLGSILLSLQFVPFVLTRRLLALAMNVGEGRLLVALFALVH